MAQEIDGTDYKYWRYQLRDWTSADCKAALDALQDYEVDPYKLTWSELRKLLRAKKTVIPSHKAFLPAPKTKPSSAEYAHEQCQKLRELFK